MLPVHFKIKEAMNKEAETNKNEVGTLLTMLQLLSWLGVTDSILQRVYGLNRASLNKVRKGGELRNVHAQYFKVLLSELNSNLEKSRVQMDVDKHRKIKDVMFEVMLREALK